MLFSASNASILANRAVLTTTLVVSDGPGIDGVLVSEMSVSTTDPDMASSDKEGSSCT